MSQHERGGGKGKIILGGPAMVELSNMYTYLIIYTIDNHIASVDI